MSDQTVRQEQLQLLPGYQEEFLNSYPDIRKSF